MAAGWDSETLAEPLLPGLVLDTSFLPLESWTQSGRSKLFLLFNHYDEFRPWMRIMQADYVQELAQVSFPFP